MSAAEAVLALPPSPVYDALARSHVMAVNAETPPDDVAGVLVALRDELAGSDPLTVALAREHVLRHLRGAGYADAPRLLDAALGRNGTPPARLPGELAPLTLGELAADADLASPQRWLLHEYVGAGEALAVYGAGKIGKTTMLAQLAAAKARGLPFLDRATTRGGVLWVDNENSRRRTMQKLRDAGCPDEILVHCGRPPTAEAVRRLIVDRGLELVVIDSLIGQLRPADENDAAEIRALLTPWYELAHETDATVIAVHHARKGGGDHGDAMRGSSTIRDSMDAYIGMTRVSGPETDDSRRRLEYEGRNDQPPHVLFTTRDPAGRYVLADSPAQERRSRILAALGDRQLDGDALAAELGVTKAAVLGELQLLAASGELQRAGTGRRGDPFTFARAGKRAA
ncbi:MAG: AAA family ATPase [Gemmatimonadales bacterium]